MNDARISVNLPTHPKTKKLMKRRGPAGPWSLVCLFLWAAANRSDGNLSGMSVEDIELAASWTGDDGVFVKDIKEIGFLDGTPGTYTIHDWAEHNPWAAGANDRSSASKWAALCKRYGQKGAADRMPDYAARMRGAQVAHADGTNPQCPVSVSVTVSDSNTKNPPTPFAASDSGRTPTDVDLVSSLTDEIWAMAHQTAKGDRKRAGGFIDDFRLVKGWLEGGHTPEAIRTAAKAVIDSAGEIRNLWALMAKAVPEKLTGGVLKSLTGDYGFDPSNHEKELYARCVIFFTMGKWRERMPSGRVLGPAPGTDGCTIPAEIIAKAKLDPKVIAAQNNQPLKATA